MNSVTQKKLLILAFLPSLLSLQIQANTLSIKKINSDLVKTLYHQSNLSLKSDIPTRLETISALFLGKPYLLNALGEGDEDIFDQAPIYRFDAMDCETFVDTVLALAFATNEDHFERCIRKIRYLDGKVSFINRNHFTAIDWNQNNQRQSFLKDITSNIKNKENQPVSKVDVTVIDKPSWYQHLDIKAIRLQSGNQQLKETRLKKLKALGSKLTKVESRLNYIPLSVMFDSNGKPDLFLFNQIPNAAIVEIVRPNWDLKNKIGTNLNISHLGFVFWKNNVLYFREASTIDNKVIDVPLIDYLREALKSPTIGGINVQVVVPQSVHETICLA